MHKLYQSTKVEHDRPVEGIVKGNGSFFSHTEPCFTKHFKTLN